MAASRNTPSERDLELLSAYLDGELSVPDRQQLERRLAHDAALRAALNDLRDTVALLRGLPRLKAPRNFTLDPAVYGRRLPWWSRWFNVFNGLQLAGALGTVAALVLILFGFLLQSGSGETRDSSLSQPPSAPDMQPQVAVVPTLTGTSTVSADLAASATRAVLSTLAPTPTLSPLTSGAASEEDQETFAFQPTQPTTDTPAALMPAPAEEAAAQDAAAPETMMESEGGDGAAEEPAGMAPPQPFGSPEPLMGESAASGAVSITSTATATFLPTPSPLPTITPMQFPTATLPPAQNDTDDTALRETGESQDTFEAAEEQAGAPVLKDATEPTIIANLPTAIEPEQPQTTSEPSEPSSEDPDSPGIWLLQLGVVLLLVSLSSFVWGYWKARH